MQFKLNLVENAWTHRDLGLAAFTTGLAAFATGLAALTTGLALDLIAEIIIKFSGAGGANEFIAHRRAGIHFWQKHFECLEDEEDPVGRVLMLFVPDVIETISGTEAKDLVISLRPIAIGLNQTGQRCCIDAHIGGS